MQEIFKCFNPKFYKDIVTQSFLKSWLFLVVFILIFSGIIGIKASLFFVSALDVFTKTAIGMWQSQSVEEIPAIEIKDNQLVMPMQAYIKEFNLDDKKDVFAFAIEPDLLKVNSVLEKYNNIVLIAKDKFIVKQKKTDNSFEQKTNMYESVNYFKLVFSKDVLKFILDKKTFDITPAVIHKWMGIVKVFSFPVVWLFVFIWFNFTKIIQILIFSLFAKLFALILKVDLEYKSLLNICVYAIVPATLISVFAIVFNVSLLASPIVYIPVYLISVYFGVKNSVINSELV